MNFKKKILIIGAILTLLVIGIGTGVLAESFKLNQTIHITANVESATIAPIDNPQDVLLYASPDHPLHSPTNTLDFGDIQVGVLQTRQLYYDSTEITPSSIVFDFGTLPNGVTLTADATTDPGVIHFNFESTVVGNYDITVNASNGQ